MSALAIWRQLRALSRSLTTSEFPLLLILNAFMLLVGDGIAGAVATYTAGAGEKLWEHN
jgi:hypothetical protein